MYKGKHPYPVGQPINRSRTNNLVEQVTVGHWLNSSGGDFPESWLSQSGSSTCNDTITIGWREIIAKGGIINNPVSITHDLLTITPGYQKGTEISSGSWNAAVDLDVTGIRLPYCAPTSPRPTTDAASWNSADSAARSQAVRTAVASIDESPVSLMEDFLSVRETMKYIASKCGTVQNIVSKAAKDVRNTKTRKFAMQSTGRNSVSLALSDQLSKKQSAKSAQYSAHKGDPVLDAANLYTEARFAVAPILHSIHDAYSQFHNGKPRYKGGVTKGTGSATTVASGTWDSIYNGNPDIKVSFDEYIELSSKYHCVLHYELKDAHDSIAYQYGLRARDIPRGLWNVVPLSFVVDRFVNMSSYIQAWNKALDPNITLRFGTLSRRSSTVTRIQMRSWDQLGYNTVLNGSIRTSVASLYERKSYGVDPSDLVDLPPLRLDSFSSVTKSCDLAALALQRAKGSVNRLQSALG